MRQLPALGQHGAAASQCAAAAAPPSPRPPPAAAPAAAPPAARRSAPRWPRIPWIALQVSCSFPPLLCPLCLCCLLLSVIAPLASRCDGGRDITRTHSRCSSVGGDAHAAKQVPLGCIAPHTAPAVSFRASDRRHWRGNPFPTPAGAELPLPPSVREVARLRRDEGIAKRAFRAGARNDPLLPNVKLHNFKAINFSAIVELFC